MLRFQVIVSSDKGSVDDSSSWPTTFDGALGELSLLPRLFIEPDGSFVWRGRDTAEGEWQVDGNLIDRGDVLAYVELNGCCPRERFDELLRAVGWPQQPVAYQLPRRGVVLEESEFRRQAESEAGAI